MRSLASLLLLAGTLALGLTAPGSPAQAADRAIEQVVGDVYRFQNKFHHALFVVTEEGIVVTDPINADAVAWLKAELDQRFGKPVTHMVLSHHHGDHASGGQAWGEGLTVIAHKKAKEHILAGATDTAVPSITFSDQTSFATGGKTFELTYLGEGHSDDLVALVVRPENVAFVVDAVSPKRLPYRDFPRTDIDGLIEQIKAVEALDFEILAPGHSVLGEKQDATNTRLYIEELMAAVTAALKAGKSEEEAAAAVTMPDYKDWGAYEQWRELNVRGMARWLKASGKLD